jgi:hypothetical protein
MLPQTRTLTTTSMSRALVLTALGALLAGCITTSTGPHQDIAEGPWVEPSPTLQIEIERHAELFPYLQKLQQFQNEILYFVQVGEPAYPVMLDLVENGDEKSAGIALAVLSSTGDVRLVPYLQKIPWPDKDDTEARYERARCLVSLGDWEPMAILVAGLRDEELWSRALSFKALRQATNQTFDYLPQENDLEIREAAVVRWDEWLGGLDIDPLRK